MKLSSGYPLDLIRNGIPYDYPKLATDRRATVVIMGGGISGALTAYFLRKAGVDCLLVDGRSIGLGSTCASTSLLQYELDKPLHQLEDRIGPSLARLAYVRNAQSIQTLEQICSEIGFADFKRRKSIYFAALSKDRRMLEREYEARLRCGFDVQWADKEDLDKKYGLQAPAAIVSSLAAQTNAYMLTHALHQYNIKGGMEVYDRTKLMSIDHSKKGVKMVTEEGHVLRCKKLVYATGYESVHYVDPQRIQLSVTYAAASEQFPKGTRFWEDEAIFWNTGDPYLYMRLTTDNRILVGGRDDEYSTLRKNEALAEAKGKQLVRDFTRYFPAIPFKREFSWMGIFGGTRDGLPYIGPYSQLPNSYFALGFGGNGISFSVMAGEMIAAGIQGKRKWDFGFTRPTG